MLCIFPFEAELYNQSGLRTQFVGHPMMERLEAQKIERPRDPQLVGLFPGSRRREVRTIFPVLLDMVQHLQAAQPALRFEVAAASADLAMEMQEMLNSRAETLSAVQIKISDASGTMQRAGVGVIASGSATLEAAFFRLPFVLVYKVSWLTYLAARLVVKVKHLGMPNVLADKEIVPEFIQHHAKPRAIADAVRRLIDQPERRSEMVSNFDKIISSLGRTGASMEAARVIVRELSKAPEAQ
jgi:lipid-A-disaccharide synthase